MPRQTVVHPIVHTCSNLVRPPATSSGICGSPQFDLVRACHGVTRERDVHCFSHSTSSLPEFACYALPFSGDSVSMPNPLFCSSKARRRPPHQVASEPFAFTFGLRCGSLSVCNDGCQEDCVATSLYAVRQITKTIFFVSQPFTPSPS